jgi:hypothetical protein
LSLEDLNSAGKNIPIGINRTRFPIRLLFAIYPLTVLLKNPLIYEAIVLNGIKFEVETLNLKLSGIDESRALGAIPLPKRIANRIAP